MRVLNDRFFAQVRVQRSEWDACSQLLLDIAPVQFIGDGDTLVKSHVRKMHIGPDQEFVEVDELDFHDLY